MNKSTLISLFAVCTLLAALYFASMTAIAPDPVIELNKSPPVVQEAATPITHYSYGDHILKADLHFDRILLKPNKFASDGKTASQSIWTHLDVEAVANPAPAQPIATVLVIDRSGSMTGEKMTRAKRAAFRLIKQLGARDKLAIVSYGTAASIDLPLTAMNAKGQKSALDALDTIQEAGGTNIEHALQLAHQVSKSTTKGFAGRVLFLSDGRPTEGNRNWQILKRISQKVRANGFRVTTIGIGSDYNEDLLRRIAEAGAGLYYHINKSEKLGKVFHDELRHARRTVANQVSVELPREGIVSGHVFRLEEVLGRQPGVCRHQTCTVALGDLASGERRTLLVKYTYDRLMLSSGLQRADESRNFMDLPTISYAAPSGPRSTVVHPYPRVKIPVTTNQHEAASSINEDIAIRVASFEADRAVHQSMTTLENGKKEPAIRLLKNQTDKINRLLTSEEPVTQQHKSAAESRALINKIIEDIDSSKKETIAAPEYIKEQKARAYQRLHGPSN